MAEENGKSNKNSYCEQVTRLSFIESTIQYIYHMSERFETIEELREYCRQKLVNYEKIKMKHIEGMIDDPLEILPISHVFEDIN